MPEDTVLVSGEDRAKLLSQRIEENYGRIDVPKLIEIIKRPVAMQSNLHDAIFAPETLEMWFADAGTNTPACDEPYAHVNLRELMEFYRQQKKPAHQQQRNVTVLHMMRAHNAQYMGVLAFFLVRFLRNSDFLGNGLRGTVPLVMTDRGSPTGDRLRGHLPRETGEFRVPIGESRRRPPSPRGRPGQFLKHGKVDYETLA